LALVPALFSLVKFAHTVFALPFALAGALLARMEIPSAGRIGWILLAMAGARSLAMALNRLIDMPLDARNPRTAGRELPSGKLTRSQVIVFSAGSLAALLVAVSQLPRLTWVLWPIPVALFVIYPYMKRFSWTCHLVLGISIGIAPIGGWVAVTGSVAPAAFALWIAVAAWVAGFDMLYALLDVESDRATGIHSVPVRFGERGALIGCRILHAISVAAMVAVGRLVDAGAWYAIGVAVCALILLWENIAVRGGDRRAVQIAFGVANGVVAFVYFAFVLIEVVSR
jgi:4-hydroxybenzoate polyprenyltransferase